ncbi:MAG TPA: hypothetical protein VES95_08800 [Dermatophilaceae bacterium]|nr:hypothetical protein [Dermatophilaceae bacterium]
MTVTAFPVATVAGPDRPAALRWLAEVVTVATALGSVFVFLAYAVRTGLSMGSAGAALAAVAITQVLPGAVLWRAVRPRGGWLVEDLAVGFALGTAMAIGAQVLAGLTRVPWLSVAIPLCVPVALLVVRSSRRRVLQARASTLPWWWGPLVGVTAAPAVLQLVPYFRAHRLAWPPGAWRVHVDAFLHQALAGQLLTRGPTSWPTVVGEDLGYHWFAHAWIAQTARASGLGLDEVLLRVMPAVVPGLIVLSVAAGAVRLSGRPITGPMAAAVTMAGGQVNVFGKDTFGLPLTPLSPTMALGVPTLIALIVVLAVRWRGESLSGAFVLVPVLAVVAAGTKGSTSPLVVAGLGLAAVAMGLWNRRMLSPVLLDLAVVAGALVLTVVVVFRGSSAGLALGLTEAAAQTPLHGWLGGLPSATLQRTALTVTALAILGRAAPMVMLPLHRPHRQDPVIWLLIGAVLSGAGGVVVFSHPGASQYYFAGTAIPLMGMGTALALLEMHRRFGTAAMWRLGVVSVVGGVLLATVPPAVEGELATGQYERTFAMLGWGLLVLLGTAAVGLLLVQGGVRTRILAALAAGALTLTAAGIAVIVRSGAGPLPSPPQPVDITAAYAVTQDQIDAARWIRDNSDIDDLVMVNRHCTVPREPRGGCDSRRWVVTAFTERQSLIEGWTATPTATRIAPEGRDSITVDYWRPELLELNDGFFVTPTAAAARQLQDLGVRWVYVDGTRPAAPTLAPYAQLRFENRDARVYELPELR